MIKERIEDELGKLADGGQLAELIVGDRSFVLYRDVPTDGLALGLPAEVDVVVPVPAGHPAGMIDMAGLPADSPFIGRVKGQAQDTVIVGGRQFRLISYHPHGNAGGPPYDPNRHGFHTYYDWLLTWLALLT